MNQSGAPTRESIPDILSLPNELLILIFTKAVRPGRSIGYVDNTSRSYRPAVQRKTHPIAFSIVLTCRRFRDIATPLLYPFCLLRYVPVDGKHTYCWSPAYPGIQITDKYALFKRYGTAVRAFCFTQYYPSQDPYGPGSLQEVHTPIPELVHPLLSSFKNLKEARFYGLPRLTSASLIQLYIDGIQDVLTTCLSLKYLLFQVEADAIICDSIRRENISETALPNARAHLEDLRVDFTEIWGPNDDQIFEEQAAFSVLGLFCDAIWLSATTVKTLSFRYWGNYIESNYNQGILEESITPSNPLLRRYTLPLLENVIAELRMASLIAFDRFFIFQRSEIKSLEFDEYFTNIMDWGTERESFNWCSFQMNCIDFTLRFPNVENVSIRDRSTSWEASSVANLVINKLFSLQGEGLKNLKKIQFYTPRYKHDDQKIAVADMDEDLVRKDFDHCCTVTPNTEHSRFEYGAHLSFSC